MFGARKPELTTPRRSYNRSVSYEFIACKPTGSMAGDAHFDLASFKPGKVSAEELTDCMA